MSLFQIGRTMLVGHAEKAGVSLKQAMVHTCRPTTFRRPHTKETEILLICERRMKKKSLIVKFKASTLSHFHTPGQSLREMGALIGLLLSERYKNCWTQPPQILTSESCGWRVSLIWLTIQQALHLKHTDPFSTVRNVLIV